MRASDSVPAASSVGIVTVAYRSEDVLPALLASIGTASASPVSVVIADNSDSSTLRELAGVSGSEYLSLPENRGYGAAANAAVRQLSPEIEWVLITNPDIKLTPGSIDRLVAAGDETPRAGSVGPTILNSDGTVYPSARPVPSLRVGAGHALFGSVWPGNPWSRKYRPAQPRDRVSETGWLSGACLLVRRSAFDEIEGFDEGYFMYFEDVDLGARLARAGYRNIYEPRSEVIHSGAHATSTNAAAMVRAHHESARRFLDKKHSGHLLWPVRFVLGTGLRIRSRLLTGRR